jgi:hypothetical protein
MKFGIARAVRLFAAGVRAFFQELYRTPPTC